MPGQLYTPIDAYQDTAKLQSDLQSSQVLNLLRGVQAQQASMDFEEQKALRDDLKNALSPDGTIDYGKVQQAFMKHAKPEQAISIQNMLNDQQLFNMGKNLLGNLGGLGGQQKPQMQQTQQLPQAAAQAMGALSPKDMATISQDMARNPNAPAQFVGQTQGTPSFGEGIGLNQQGIQAGAYNVNQPQQPQQQQQQGGLYGLPQESLALNMLGGRAGMQKIAQDISEYAKPINLRPGGSLVTTGPGGERNIGLYSPIVGEGQTLNAQGIASPVPGYLNNLQQILQAKQDIENQNKPVTMRTPSGREVITTVGNQLRGINQSMTGAPGAPPGLSIIPEGEKVPDITGFGMGKLQDQGIGMPGIPSGQSKEEELLLAKRAPLAEEAAMDTMKGASAARTMQARLQDIGGVAQRLNSGPGTNWQVAALKLLNSIPGVNINKEKITNFDELEKAVIPIMADQSKVLGTREAASIVMMIRNALPNAEMNKDTLMHIAGSMSAMNDYSIAKNNALMQWRITHGQSPIGFEEQWNNQIEPGVFALKYLNPQEQKDLHTYLSKTNQWNDFKQSVQKAQAMGILR